MSDRPLHVLDHPLVRDRLARMRDERTPRADFRALLEEITILSVFVATRELGSRPTKRRTPVGEAETAELLSRDMTVVPILRAGLGMSTAMSRILPEADVGMIGLSRDPETMEPNEYLVKLPPDHGGPVFVCDPMVATGGTAVHALDLLNDHGIEDDRIRFLGLVTVPEGLDRFFSAHPKVRLSVAAVDSHLNEEKEIVPGVGDVGDRLYGT